MRRPSNQGGRFNDPLLSTGTTPLLRALINNDTDVARLLLESGANPNIYGMGLSPWLYAAGITSGTFNQARGGGAGGTVDTALLDLMLAHGADVNARVTGAASYSGRIARALTGDPVNTTSNEGMTALHVAVRSQNASLVRYLLDKGARTDIKDASGRTPLDVLNGVPAFQPAVFADADGVVPPNANAAPARCGCRRALAAGGGAGGRGGGNPAAVSGDSGHAAGRAAEPVAFYGASGSLRRRAGQRRPPRRTCRSGRRPARSARAVAAPLHARRQCGWGGAPVRGVTRVRRQNGRERGASGGGGDSPPAVGQAGYRHDGAQALDLPEPPPASSGLRRATVLPRRRTGAPRQSHCRRA